MRHDPVEHPLHPNQAPPASGDLSLLLVTGLADGLPVLDGVGVDHQVVSLSPVSQDEVGKLAACRFAQAGDRPLVIVLGYVALSSDTLVALMSSFGTTVAPKGSSTTRALHFAIGRSELRLDPDGRISLIGDDVVLRARKGMRVRGATIDLN